MLTGIKSYFSNVSVKTNYALVESTDSPEKINEFIEQQIDVLAFNSDASDSLHAFLIPVWLIR